jgi:hypothetical protein
MIQRGKSEIVGQPDGGCETTASKRMIKWLDIGHVNSDPVEAQSRGEGERETSRDGMGGEMGA